MASINKMIASLYKTKPLDPILIWDSKPNIQIVIHNTSTDTHSSLMLSSTAKAPKIPICKIKKLESPFDIKGVEEC